ncbi:AMP-dependent synthetase and ligase [Isoalcanivorax pacificus W11-5]|uniref:AMP-dependent synthetase and ligase n=1 Tax=Isoalcanivorax pacificus W11-5 TaxID=391936 RepID=A0A0B4XKW7_9GAMM|nr:long-chain-fatty-acid--CoA ligase [Isoalcanivorax pacificus]AJD47756.1 AMP-dependent synthetase and ligase [Isoalcanivorax pacificus W11-5]
MYLTQGLHRAVQQFPDRLATIQDDRRTSYRELGERCARLAGALQRAGVKPGDRVGLLALNSDFHTEYFLGCWWAGAVCVPVNTRWSEQEIIYSLDDSDTALLFVDDAFAPMAASLLQGARALQTVVHLGQAETPEGVTAFGDWLHEAPQVEDCRRGGDEMATILYTGGTTGFPKGVMLSHRNLWSSAVARMAEGEPLRHHVSLYVAPLFHTASLGKLISQIMVAGTSVAVPAFRVEEVMALISRERINDVVLVPSMIQMMLDHPAFADYDLDCLERITYGASPIALAVLERAMKAFPKAQFSHAYGMTETAPVISINPWFNHLPEAWESGIVRSAGRAGLCVEVRIVDEDDNEVPRGTVGEVIARGPNVMLGYWKKPEATAEALRNGWMHTGDGGYMDENGYLYIVDRIKDMIISGGENVYSAEVENILARHEAVQACAVIGVPSEAWGEAVHAVVVKREGVSVTAETLQAFCRECLAGYKVPKSVEFVEALPMSGPGKVLKHVLREPYWKGRERQVS